MNIRTLLLLLSSLSISSSAFADGLRFGIGAESPLAVGPLLSEPEHLLIPGLSLRLQLSDAFGLQLIGSVQSQFYNQDTGPSSAVTLGGASLRGHLRLFDVDNLRVGAVAGVTFWSMRTKRGDVVSSNRFLSIEAGLRPELFLADGRISFHLQVGLSFAMSFDSSELGATSESIGFSFARGADLLTAAGLTIWFGGSGSGQPAAEPTPEPTPAPAPAPAPARTSSEPVDTGW